MNRFLICTVLAAASAAAFASPQAHETRRDIDKVNGAITAEAGRAYGDLGTVIAIDEEDGVVLTRFDGRDVPYALSELDTLVPAYATTIHKSQGSEYPAVVIPIHTQHYVLLQRNLLYTGITRGKELVVLVGTKKAMSIAVKNDRTKHRYTYLGERLKKILRW